MQPLITPAEEGPLYFVQDADRIDGLAIGMLADFLNLFCADPRAVGVQSVRVDSDLAWHFKAV